MTWLGSQKKIRRRAAIVDATDATLSRLLIADMLQERLHDELNWPQRAAPIDRLLETV
jgi:hypothetical protein